MEQAVTLRQVLSLLGRTAHSLHMVFHSVLVLWLQFQEEAQQQRQEHHAEAAVQAVQAALRGASMCATDDLKLAWMKLHAPSVSMAVTAHVAAQSDIRLKRLRILHKLTASQGEAQSEQLSASWKAEIDFYFQVTAASNLAAFLAALSTVMKALSGRWHVGRSGSSQQQEQCKHSYRQRNLLLASMTSELVSEHARLVTPISLMRQLICESLTDADLEEFQPQSLPTRSVYKDMESSQLVQARASLAWLELALCLPYTDKHNAPQAWLRVVGWDAHMALKLQDLCQDLPQACFGELVCRVLARPDLLGDLAQQQSVLSSISCVLHTYGVTPKQMRDAGVTQAVVQQLSHMSQANHMSQIIDSVKDNFKDVVRRERHASQQEHAADGSSSCTEGGAGDHDSSLDEMQALVHLMYGSLDVKL